MEIIKQLTEVNFRFEAFQVRGMTSPSIVGNVEAMVIAVYLFVCPPFGPHRARTYYSTAWQSSWTISAELLEFAPCISLCPAVRLTSFVGWPLRLLCELRLVPWFPSLTSVSLWVGSCWKDSPANLLRTRPPPSRLEGSGGNTNTSQKRFRYSFSGSPFFCLTSKRSEILGGLMMLAMNCSSNSWENSWNELIAPFGIPVNHRKAVPVKVAYNNLHLTASEPPEISIWAWKALRCVFGSSTPENGGILGITMFGIIGSSMMAWLKGGGSALFLLPAWSPNSCIGRSRIVLLISSFALCNSSFAPRAYSINLLDASTSSLILCCSSWDSAWRRSCSTWNSWARLLDSSFSCCRVCIASTICCKVRVSPFSDIGVCLVLMTRVLVLFYRNIWVVGTVLMGPTVDAKCSRLLEVGRITNELFLVSLLVLGRPTRWDLLGLPSGTRSANWMRRW